MMMQLNSSLQEFKSIDKFNESTDAKIIRNTCFGQSVNVTKPIRSQEVPAEFKCISQVLRCKDLTKTEVKMRDYLVHHGSIVLEIISVSQKSAREKNL